MRNHNYLICLVYVVFLVLFSSFAFAAPTPGIIRTVPTSLVNGSTVTITLNITASGSYSLDDSAPAGWVITSVSTGECQFFLNKTLCANANLAGGLQSRLITYNVVVNNTNGQTAFVGSYSVDGASGTTANGPLGSANNPPSTPTITGPGSGITNTQYSFTASSADPDGDQVKYEWDFNGDGIIDATSNLMNSNLVLVNIQSMAFAPQTISIKKGATIRWTNKDTVSHSATSDTAGIFDTGFFSQGQTKDIILNTPGTFAYHCAAHSSMTGSIVVEDSLGDVRSNTFPTPGTYNVKVRAVDSSGSSSNFAQTPIIITIPAPTNNPPSTPTITGPGSGITNTQYTFTATATDPDNNQIKYEWDWNNDGVYEEPSNLVNSGVTDSRTHVFTAAGTYTIKVRSTDISGLSSSASQAIIIITQPPSVSASIGGPYSGFVGSAIQFTSQITGGTPPYTYSWNFGDAATSNQQNPTHSYGSVGSYTAQLTVTDSLSASLVKTASVTVSSGQISTTLTGNVTRIIPSSVAAGSIVTIALNVDVGTGIALGIDEYPPTGWQLISVENKLGCSLVPIQNPTSIGCAVLSNPTSGIVYYNVSVPSSASIGSTHIFSGSFGIKKNAQESTVIRTTVGNTSTTIGSIADFSISSQPTSSEIVKGSSSSFQITATSINGYTSQISLSTLSLPSGVSISFSPQIGTQTFVSVATISVSSTAQNGTYPITIRATGTDGKIKDNIYILTIKDPTIIPPLLASTGGPYNKTINTPILFSSVVSGGISPYTYNWSFGDGITSTNSAPSYIYNTAGNYTITLTVKDSSGLNITNTTIASINPVPVIPLTASTGGPYLTIVNTSVQLSSIISGGISPYTYNWSFGNGANSSQQNPLYVYNVTGNYTLILTVKDSSGLSITNTTLVSIIPASTNQTKFTIIIDTTPVKGNIIINGTSQGIAPITLLLNQGSHSISYSAIAGYTSPANETITLTQNQTLNRIYSIGVIASCGDGLCNGGETTSSCPQDCGSSQCISNIVFKDSERLELSATCLSANVASSWNVNDVATFPVTAFSIIPKTSMSQNTITIKKITFSSAGLSNPYQYFNITSSINDSSINSGIISFVVRNTWISSNKIKNDTISLYKYTFGWDKIPTTRVKNDTTYTYYQATIQGLGLYATDGQKADCPICNQPTAWSSCINSVQTRTSYVCNDPIIGCISAQESSACCPTCPANSESACINGVITKKAYRCGPDTNFVCSESIATPSCISSQDAQTAINNAITAIDKADKDSKNTTTAKDLLLRSQAAFAISDYQNARQLASDAEASAKSSPILAKPFFLPIPFEFLIIAIVAAAASGAGILVWKKRLGASLCTVCAKPTAMKFLCGTCNGHVCFKDSKIYQGKVYCSNCLRRLGMSQPQQPPR